jgi:lysophospholipase L1-like esterase
MPEIISGIDSPEKVSCVVILLGANDATHENCPSGQHVPLEEYKSNLKEIVTRLESSGMKRDRIILVNPPTYYHDVFVETKPELPPCRSSESATLYANACLEAGKDMGITCLNIHSVFAEDPRGRNLFTDGLHLAPAGSELLFKELLPFVEKKILEFKTGDASTNASLEQNFPYWMEIREKFKNK